MLTVWYPFNKIKKMAKLMLQVPKLPSYIKKWQAFATADGEKGIKAYNLIMVEGNSDEAVIFIVQSQLPFTEAIEGYSYKIEPVMGTKDSLKALGM